MSELVHFLITFDRAACRILFLESFILNDDAVSALFEAERKYYRNEEIEVVLLSADSIETLVQTHGRYFSGKRKMEDYSKLLKI